jgi:hypothetical protein
MWAWYLHTLFMKKRYKRSYIPCRDSTRVQEKWKPRTHHHGNALPCTYVTYPFCSLWYPTHLPYVSPRRSLTGPAEPVTAPKHLASKNRLPCSSLSTSPAAAERIEPLLLLGRSPAAGELKLPGQYVSCLDLFYLLLDCLPPRFCSLRFLPLTELRFWFLKMGHFLLLGKKTITVQN